MDQWQRQPSRRVYEEDAEQRTGITNLYKSASDPHRGPGRACSPCIKLTKLSSDDSLSFMFPFQFLHLSRMFVTATASFRTVTHTDGTNCYPRTKRRGRTRLEYTAIRTKDDRQQLGVTATTKEKLPVFVSYTHIVHITWMPRRNLDRLHGPPPESPILCTEEQEEQEQE
jgi:hypothetical protein